MIDDVPEPKSDLEKWKPVVDALTELRDNLRQIQVANNQRMLDRIDQSVVQSECAEANEVLNYIMRK
jgi:hypothetical protein